MKKTIKKPANGKSRTTSAKITYRTSKNNSNPQIMPSNIKKQYLKSAPQCKVTFRLPKEAAPDAKSVAVAGDFNNWNVVEHPMKKLKNGDFKVTLSLSCNREYKFKYLIDANRWENDWFADKYIPNGYGSDDSVVVV